MIAARSVDVRDNFKSLCEQVFSGETVIISRPRNENIVMISENVYNALQKSKRNEEYQKIIDESSKQIENNDIIMNKVEGVGKYKNVIWSKIALEQYNWWELNDKKNVKCIDDLIDSIIKEGILKGLGNPEQLKYINGYNRFIDINNRLLYKVNKDKDLVIITCKGHYEY